MLFWEEWIFISDTSLSLFFFIFKLSISRLFHHCWYNFQMCLKRIKNNFIHSYGTWIKLNFCCFFPWDKNLFIIIVIIIFLLKFTEKRCIWKCAASKITSSVIRSRMFIYWMAYFVGIRCSYSSLCLFLHVLGEGKHIIIK